MILRQTTKFRRKRNEFRDVDESANDPFAMSSFFFFGVRIPGAGFRFCYSLPHVLSSRLEYSGGVKRAVTSISKLGWGGCPNIDIRMPERPIEPAKLLNTWLNILFGSWTTGCPCRGHYCISLKDIEHTLVLERTHNGGEAGVPSNYWRS